jgi:uncharacterized protein YcsI (UPF0317 family)
VGGLTPAAIRAACRAGTWSRPTAGLAPSFAQANLAIVPRDWAYDLLLFCQRNPKPCPLLEVTEPGSPEPVTAAPGADLRTDLPRYRVFRDGELAEEPADIAHLWRDDLVAFLLGCSFTFEHALVRAGIPLRHLAEGRNVAMYRTRVGTQPAGRLHGPLVVSMRPLAAADVARAVQISGRYPAVHGAPVHVGEPAALGIADIRHPDYGDPTEVRAGEVPVFWACGVTPQAVAVAARVPLLITHAPGHMFVTDIPEESLAAS